FLVTSIVRSAWNDDRGRVGRTPKATSCAGPSNLAHVVHERTAGTDLWPGHPAARPQRRGGGRGRSHYSTCRFTQIWIVCDRVASALPALSHDRYCTVAE